MAERTISAYLMPDAKVHLIGIAGVSMAPLAKALFASGIHVTGSDLNEGPVTKELEALGICVRKGHLSAYVTGVDAVIRTAAARDDNPEIKAAREQGIPVFERAEAWGYIMQQYKNAICIAGTHGKTTTTSMCTHILLAADLDPTVMIGGSLAKIQSGHRVGAGDTIVLESCEYYNSFHNFFPTIAVILNVEEDHLDYFKDLAEIQASFCKFADLVPEDGAIIANGDDKKTMDALCSLTRDVWTFGFGEENRISARNVAYQDVGSTFDLYVENEFYCTVSLSVPGAHNISNALAAIGTALILGLDATAICEGLSDFTGAGRRFEYKGMVNGATVYDDYAHHPTELAALIDAVEKLDFKRCILAFQPHTYTRTKALFDDFVRELKRLENVYITEIFAAREENTVGIFAEDVVNAVPGAKYIKTLEEMTAEIRAIAKEGDLILTVGAGDIFKVGEMLISS